MGISYFGDKKWATITREERLFCSHLYFDIRMDIKGFIIWLNKQLIKDYKQNSNWEVGFEVCFYRDFLFEKGLSAKEQDYPPKRTFDLCLFSEDKIIIFEAKAQQGFKNKQVSDIEKDRDYLKKLLGIECDVIALISSRYKCNSSKFGKKELLKKFDGIITWKEVYSRYNDESYNRADDIYKPKLKK